MKEISFVMSGDVTDKGCGEGDGEGYGHGEDGGDGDGWRDLYGYGSKLIFNRSFRKALK